MTGICGTPEAYHIRTVVVRHGTVQLRQDPSDEELARDWTLNPADLDEVRRSRGSDKRLSFALQLCVVRLTGRFLGSSDYTHVPVRITNHVGFQLGLPPVLLVEPPAREATDLEHERRIRAHLGLSVLDEASRASIETWLDRQAADGLLVAELVALAERETRARRFVLPAVSTLGRMAQRVATRSEKDVLRVISDRLSSELRIAIDRLLEVRERDYQSSLADLKQYPPEPTPASIKAYLERAELLRNSGVDEINLMGIRPELVHAHAELVRRYDANDLKRFQDAKRHALMACFLVEVRKSTLDHLVDMHHVFLTGLQRRARNAFEKQHRALRKKSGRQLELVLNTLESLLNPAGAVEANSFDVEAVRAAMQGCRELQHLTQRGEYDALLARHGQLKQYLPTFLQLPFEGEPGAEPLLDAIDFARALHAQGRTKLGPEAPTEFATGSWKKRLRQRTDIRTWDLALALAVRDALRSGDLFLADSRNHVSFWNMLRGPEEWADERDRVFKEMGLPTQPEHALDRLADEYESALSDFDGGLDANPFARVDARGLRLAKRDSIDTPAAVADLRRAIEAHLPRIRIEDLLIEVDGWTGFTNELVPPTAYAQRQGNDHSTLLAALVAHGTNLGIATMAQSTRDITIDMLHRTSKWCLRPEALRAANRVLVDYHHRLPLSDAWGDGTRSSSDGQRFSVQRSSLLAGFYPRYFGYFERAINVYTHISDKFSVFAARAISCSPREAIYVLDGLLANDTLLEPREHYTDTHGFVEPLFGLCYLLGFSFMPRLKDLKDQRLYMVDRERVSSRLRPLFHETINVSLIREQWDQLVRVAASLRDRTSPAHVVLDRLVASSRSDRLAKALTMLGRLVKTTYLLRYLHEPQMRDRVHLQLNRGESRQGVARRVFFANQGSFRSGDYAEIMNKVSALSVLSNAVLAWNTVKYGDILARLEASGTPVERQLVARVSPLLHAHVIPSGTYRFTRKGD